MNATRVPLLTAEEVAAQLRLSVSMVYKLAARREIESFRMLRGAVRFTQKQVDAYVESHRVPVAGAE